MSASEHVGFRSLGRGTVGGVFITLLIHGGLVALVYTSHGRGAPREEGARDLVVTQLVQLGKPREKFWLPRITEPPRPKAPEAAIKVTDNPTAPPAPKEAPRPKEAEVSKNLQRALQRAKALSAAVPEESTEGELTGSPLGTATQAQEGDAYATALYEAFRRNWTAPTGLVSEAELAGLSAEVRIKIAADGTISGVQIHKRSGNQYFDDSCVQAVQATGKVPAPPPAVVAQYRRGLALLFAGKDLAR